MKCVICRFGETAPGTATVTREKGSFVVIIRDVPGDVCDSCGEAYFSGQVVSELSRIVRFAIANGPELQRLSYPDAKEAMAKAKRKVA